MYLFEARNNLHSTVDFTWMNSIEETPPLANSSIKEKFEDNRSKITDKYNNAVEQRISKELKMDKSSFRVIPVNDNNKSFLSSRQHSPVINYKDYEKDTLNEEL